MNVNQMLCYQTLKMALGPVLGTIMRIRADGTENVPAEGAALMVGNHRNPFLDPLSISYAVQRPIVWGAASFIFKIPLMRTFAGSVGTKPIDVFGGKQGRKDLDNLTGCLEDGELVGIFPEGVHTMAKPHSVSKIQTFRTGFARVALNARVPIIPFAVIGLGERNLPRVPPKLVKVFFDHPQFQEGVQWIYYRRIRVRIGCPIDLSGYYDQEIDREVISQISGKIRRVVIKLYNGEEDERFLIGEKPFDIANDRV